MSSREEWVYGINPVLEALRGGRKVKAVYLRSGRRKRVDEIMREAGMLDVPVRDANASFFDGKFPKGHQGVAARTEKPEYMPLDEFLEIPAGKGEQAFFVLLDMIEDPRNLGAILRSSESAGVHGVVLQKHRAAGLGPAAVRASAGAAEFVPVAMVPNIKNALTVMKDEGILVVGAEGGDNPAPWDVDLSGPLALVIGSEGSGLRKTVSAMCDHVVSLPIKGKVGSLNASVAAGAIIYEILRQRSRKSQ